MDFGFSEEQEMLRKSARDFLANESAMTYVRRMMEDDRGFADAQWQKMAELGWMGLILPERYGGAGLDFVDMVVVLEEMGRVVLPGPFFSTAVLGGVALLEGGSEAQKQAYLPKLAAGELRATLAQLEPDARWDAEGIQLEARKDGGGYRLSGTKLFVPDAHTAELLIVAGRESGSTGADGVTLQYSYEAAGRLKSVARVFFKAPVDNAPQRRRKSANTGRQLLGFLSKDRAHCVGSRCSLKGTLSRNHFVASRAQGENVGASIRSEPAHLLRGHVS